MDLHFPDVQDSPLFRARCAEMESATETLRNKTKKLVAGGSRYSESLEEAFQESLRFADCIEDFCSGTDDTNSIEQNFNVGGPNIARFVQTVRELSSFIELLRTQVELIVCDRLNQRSSLMATEVRDARKRLNQRSSDYDTARSKHLGHRTLAQRAPWGNSAGKTGGSSGGGGLAHLSLGGSGTGASPERGHQVMNAARSAADEARFDLARKLVEVQVDSRYEFLESIASVMQAHLKYFEHGHNVVASLGPYIDETLQLASRLKSDAKSKQDALEEMITLQREADQVREAAAMGGEPSPTYRGGSSSSYTDGSGSNTTQAGGPLQMNIATSALASELESYIRATHESGGRQVTVLRQGWLLKQSSNFKSKWQRRFFVLDSTGTLYYYSNKTGEGRASLGGGGGSSSNKDNQQRPHHTVNLLTATVKHGAAPPKDGAPAVPFAFRVVSPEREYTLQAEDEFEMQQWVDSLQSVIACLLSGVIDIDMLSNRSISHNNNDLGSGIGSGASHSLPPPPARATHTRAISIDLAGIGTTTGRPGTGVSTPSTSTTVATEGDKLSSPSRLSITTPSSIKPSTQALLAAVPGNNQCADCGAAAPDWGSLNLGILTCIECAGYHRKLGVHISKIRSLTLDVRVWEHNVVNLFKKIGNTTANAVWEGASGAAIAIVSATASPVSTPLAAAGEFPRSRPTSFNDLVDDDGDEEWVWGADGSDPEENTAEGGNKNKKSTKAAEKTLAAAMKKLQTSGASGNNNSTSLAAGLMTPNKPSPSSSSAAKESFIVAKYVKKAYLSNHPPNINLNLSLWAAVTNSDIVATYQALVYGADVNSLYITSSEAAHLVEDTHALAGGALERVISNPRGLGDVTITHLAASKGDAVLMELLLQWGAPTESKDGYNRTPLMYGMLHDHPDVARQLIKRGVVCTGQDVMGNSVVQMIGRKGLADAELVGALH